MSRALCTNSRRLAHPTDVTRYQAFSRESWSVSCLRRRIPKKKGISFSDDNLTDIRYVYNKIVRVVDDENERTIENMVVIDNSALFKKVKYDIESMITNCFFSIVSTVIGIWKQAFFLSPRTFYPVRIYFSKFSTR